VRIVESFFSDSALVETACNEFLASDDEGSEGSAKTSGDKKNVANEKKIAQNLDK
jgi:hypothetical protein